MKNSILYILIILLSFGIYGCSKEIPVENAEEIKEIKEIKEDIEESDLDEHSEEEILTDSLENVEALYEFVKEELNLESYEEFKHSVDISMLDITKDGENEAVLFKDSGMRPIIFITLDNGKFKRIPSDLVSGQYTTKVSVDGDFIKVESSGGGTGLNIKAMSLGYYTGNKVKMVLDNLVINYSQAGPEGIKEGEGSIELISDDKYKDFEYNYKFYEEENFVRSVKKLYHFNEEIYTFDENIIEDGSDSIQKNHESRETNQEEVLLLQGKIVGNVGGNDNGNINTIFLDKKLKIKGREINRIWLRNINIEKYIPRDYFTFYYEGGPGIKTELIEKIPLVVEIDAESIEFQDFYTYGKVLKIISIDGENSPIDKSESDYPLDYYKCVFKTIYDIEGRNSGNFTPQNIKNYFLYKEGDSLFKDAVDKILESGLYINMLEGEYEIGNTKKISEEGVGK